MSEGFFAEDAVRCGVTRRGEFGSKGMTMGWSSGRRRG